MELLDFAVNAFRNREISYKTILIVVIANLILAKSFTLLGIIIFEYFPLMKYELYRGHYLDRYTLVILSLFFVNLSTGFLQGHLCKRSVYQHCLILALFLFTIESIEYIHNMAMMAFHAFRGNMGMSVRNIDNLIFEYFTLACFSILKIPTILLGGYLFLRTFKASLDEEGVIAEYLEENSESL